MGKKKRRLFSPKFAQWRHANGLERGGEKKASQPTEEDTKSPTPAEVEPDIEIVTTKDLMKESDADVIVVKNGPPKTKRTRTKKTAVPTPEPQLQQVEVERPKKKPAALKQTRTRRKTTKTKKD